MLRILIFANGIIQDAQRARMLVRADDYILCADGGTRHALALGLKPGVVIGDFDSLSGDEKAQAEAAGAKFVGYSYDKNETDLQLALDHALEMKPASIVIIGALGNRLDQTLGNIALLSDIRLATLDVRIDDGLEEAFFCRNRFEIVAGSAGDLVSLIPWGGIVTGVRTNGLKWPLNDESLYPEKTRGISNELLGVSAQVSIQNGLLFIVHRRISKVIG